MAQFFYDGQIRRYLTQLIRMLSNFKYKDASGEHEIPILYGDMTRQVASILRENSENKIPCAPRMGIYITALEQDRDNTRDHSFVDKVNVRERAFDANNQEYLNYQGKNYTVERLMPTPYKLTVNVDLWSTNTDQKLQILEQILMIFRPTVEIQTTDNFIDWTSLTTVTLESINWSSRSVPQGIDTEIDVASMTFSTPIWINPPVKVKRLGVITNIISSIFDERKGTIQLGDSIPELSRYNDIPRAGAVDEAGNRNAQTSSAEQMVNTNHENFDLFISGSTARLAQNGLIVNQNWRRVLDPEPGEYNADVSRIYIVRKLDDYLEMTGTFTLNPLDENELVINWDTDTYPDDTAITGPARNSNAFTSIDYIIDPQRTNPTNLKTPGLRILLLEDIGDANNSDGPDAWKNANNSDFIASANDIVEWTGSAWVIVFDASENTDGEYTYTTNLNTSVQYRWDGEEWLHSVDGEYPVGTWRLSLEG